MTKEELRDHLASLPIDEKFDLLEQLRQRELDIAEAREELHRKLNNRQTTQTP